MAEAVFTIQADIEPTLNPRVLERQGQEIAKQLSGTFKKELQPVDLQIRAGAAFNKVIDTAKKSFASFGQTARNTLTSVRTGFDTVVTKGRAGFLKLADTFKLTQRSLVGFGGNIKDIIDRTNLFENALEGLRRTGDAFNELPTQFQNVRSQIEAGVSPLQQAAQGGNQFAQALVPMTVISAGLARQLDTMSESLNAVARSIASVGGAASKGEADLSLLEAETEAVANRLAELGTLPGVESFNARVNELTKEALAAGGTVGDFVDKMIELRDTSQGTEASLARFGGPLGRLSALFGLVDKDAQKLARETLRDVNEALFASGPAGREALSTFQSLQIRLSNARGAFNGFKKDVEDVRDTLLRVTGLDKPFNDIRDAARKAAEEVGNTTTDIGTSLTQNLDSALAPLAGRVGQTLGGLVRTVDQALAPLAGSLGRALGGAQASLNAVGQDILQGLSDGIRGATSALSNIGSDVLEGIRGTFSGAGSILEGLGGDILQGLSDGIRGAGSALANVGREVLDGLSSGFSGAGSALANVGQDILQGLSDGISGASGALVNVGRTIIEGLSSGLRSAGGAITSIGRDIINGLTKGMEDQTSIFGKIKTVAKNIYNAFAKALGIASPSTVMIAIGKFIVQGLAKGIELSASLVLKPIQAITKGLIDTVKGAAGLAQQGFQSLINVGKAAGLALAGLGATAVVTGSQFNILQQVVNATLPSILGSAEASKALLVQVNALNDTSPFARSAFLELTRVLAGFGVEAKQITPTIDAIQQAVAATGGGEQDLLELGNAFAKIASTGRLTGDILQSFTVRGIDAIALLAAETGKTATVIREEMSSGLLGATQTINTLSTAISKRFAGATDAVAKNFPGALDRVNARIRDLGAALTKAFINPEGGGALVDLFNAMATAIGAVTKIVVPIFLPAIQVVANVMTNASKAIEDFVKPLLLINKETTTATATFKEFGSATGAVTNQIRPFIESLGPLIPILAGIVGFFPAFLSFIPVVGPMLASIGGPGGAVLAVFIALVARSKELQDALKGLVSGFQEAFNTFSQPLGGAGAVFDKVLEGVKGLESGLAGGLAGLIEPLGAAFGQLAAEVAPVVADLLPKLGSLFQTLGSTIGPVIASIVSGLSPTIAFLVGAFGEIIPAVEGALGGLQKGLEPIIEAIKNLLIALQPAADLIKGVIIVAFQILGQILPPIGELLAWVINLVTDAINAINPLIQALADAFTQFKANLQDIGQSLENFVNTAIDGINKVIRGLNLIKPGKDIKQLEDIKFPDFATGAAAAKKQVDAVGFAIKTQVPTVKELEMSYKNAFDAASKAAADAQSKVSALTDTLNQQLKEVGGKISPVFDAQGAVQASNQALADARANAAKAAGQIGELEKERAKALKEALSPVQEMAAAERELTRTRRGLEKINRDIVETEKELADLRNAELLGEKRAALDRAIERAKIALNKATRDQINLDKEANKVAIPSVNLAGLNLDQIRAKLANVRASLSAQKAAQALTQQDAKTQQEIDDERTSAALDVADAEQSLKDATRARQEFELENTNAIRDTELQLEELRFNKEEQLLKEQEDLAKINDLRAGETAHQKIIKDFEEKIKRARDDNAKAQAAVTAAVKRTQEAQAQLALVTAQLKNDTEGMASAQLRIFNLKNQGLALDKQTQAAINGQLESVRAIMRELAGAKTEAAAAEQRKREAEEAKKRFDISQAIVGINEELDRAAAFERDRGDFGLEQNRDALISGFTKLASFLRTAGDAGAIQTKSGDVAAAQRIISQPAFLEQLARSVLESPDGDLRKILKELLERAGLVIPGFARGTAPGEMVHRGMNDGKGLVRMFEYGKEAVLPLTRAMDMKRVVQNPQVLPAVLQALPKLSLAAANGDPQAIETLSAMTRATSGGTVSGSAFQSRQARKQENEQMAASIASAVKVAVKEALAESDGLGNDIDINVTPATDHNVAIANEVRRQVRKYFEGRR